MWERSSLAEVFLSLQGIHWTLLSQDVSPAVKKAAIPNTRAEGEDWVREHLAKLDIHKSMDPDGMHPRVLRLLADVIAGPLSIIFERPWRTGEMPEDWRKANSTPVFKKGKKEDPGTTGKYS
ncbi:rna-directed dna polymerase from mobile element hypothetical protein [Limosa lapponica baueri]|uniref:Rna-directed dna polymerase from mobile element jockey-like n=1 Tax=Limosa lapponica baueri TaxID=1758121 RepID=A0A2I0TGJ1_LIMLA|nr:rna-directed dna polymerase from mobile element hypothetical protein [Limosa lapponica baueri]